MALTRGSCNDGWTVFRGSCYLFADNEKRDWTESVVSLIVFDSGMSIFTNEPVVGLVVAGLPFEEAVIYSPIMKSATGRNQL